MSLQIGAVPSSIPTALGQGDPPEQPPKGQAVPSGSLAQRLMSPKGQDVTSGSLAQRRMSVPGSTKELFERLEVMAGAGKIDVLDLGKLETDILEHNSGRMLLKFRSGQVMGLDAFVREALARNLIGSGTVIYLPVDKHEWREMPTFLPWVQQISEKTGIVFVAYERTPEPRPGILI